MVNEELLQAEYGISTCKKHSECDGSSSCTVELSSVVPGDERRGSRDPQILLVTEAPDRGSSEGTAYQGGISRRIRSIFTDRKYGIGLHDNADSFSDFLCSHRIYATSAIKCYIGGSSSDLNSHIMYNCKEAFLSNQIEAMDNLKLIIPMGKVAAASMLQRGISSIKITDIIGRHGQGILTEDHGKDVPIVIFPHPSGSNPRSNPPKISDSDSRETINNKLMFREAITAVQQILDEAGYDVFEEAPDCWDSTDGLSSFF